MGRIRRGQGKHILFYYKKVRRKTVNEAYAGWDHNDNIIVNFSILIANFTTEINPKCF